MNLYLWVNKLIQQVTKKPKQRRLIRRNGKTGNTGDRNLYYMGRS